MAHLGSILCPASVALSLILVSHPSAILAKSSVAAPTASCTKLTERSLGATDKQIRECQALGKTLIAPDGSYFLYEWNRPYNWSPPPGSLPKNVRQRPQTYMYRVSVPLSPNWSELDPPTSEVLLPPSPGATYYLGELSPDAKRATFYELDRDTNVLRAGIVVTGGVLPRDIIWLSLPPDAARLDKPPVWLSNDEVLYPVTSGGFARASAQNGQAAGCADCIAKMPPRTIHPLSQNTDPSTNWVPPTMQIYSGQIPSLPAEAKVVGRSVNGSVQVLSVNTSEVLALYLNKNGHIAEIFKNIRSQ